MGCCVSRSSGPNSPYPGGAPNASSRAINPPPPLTLPDAAQDNSQRSPSRRRRRDQRPLDQHIDKPLKLHEWTSLDRTWTKVELVAERTEFFDTRVTGRPEVWQTIHAALEVLWEPSTQPDGSSGLATAQMILSAAEISLPTGDLANGVYDALGNYYQLPEWVVADPCNVTNQHDHDDGTKGELSIAGEETMAEEEMSEDEDMERRRKEKGKEVIDVEKQIPLRARLSENGKDVVLKVGESETVKNVARRIVVGAGLAATKKVRIAYMGKILKDNASLTSQGWQEGYVVNALVF